MPFIVLVLPAPAVPTRSIRSGLPCARWYCAMRNARTCRGKRVPNFVPQWGHVSGSATMLCFLHLGHFQSAVARRPGPRGGAGVCSGSYCRKTTIVREEV